MLMIILKLQKQPTTAKLNAVDGTLVTALSMMPLHLRIAEFKFKHNFVICDRLPDTKIILKLYSKEVLHFLCLG